MEGIIKAVTIEPVKLYDDEKVTTKCMVKVYLNPAALADLYISAGIDPEEIAAGYIVLENGVYQIEPVLLSEAVEDNLELSVFADITVANNEID